MDDIIVYDPPKRMAVVLGKLVIDVIVVGDSTYRYPHHEDAVLIEDDGASVGGSYDGKVFAPPPVPEVTREQLKQQRQETMDTLTVAVGSKVFDADEVSQQRMARALMVADITGQTSCVWVLHDNSDVQVTRDELRSALALAMKAQSEIWILSV